MNTIGIELINNYYYGILTLLLAALWFIRRSHAYMKCVISLDGDIIRAMLDPDFEGALHTLADLNNNYIDIYERARVGFALLWRLCILAALFLWLKVTFSPASILLEGTTHL